MPYNPGKFVQTLTANKTLDRDDQILLCDTAQPITTLTLPATHAAGKEYEIRNIGNGNLTVARNGNLIDGVANDLIQAPGDAARIVSDGTNWHGLTLQ